MVTLFGLYKQTDKCFSDPEVLGRGPEPGVLSKSLRASDLQAAVLEVDRTV